MGVHEMREVRIDEEPKYITEDSKVRLYMTVVYCQREKSRQNPRSNIGRRQRMLWRKKMEELGRLLVAFLTRLIFSLSITAAAGIWAIQKAYEDRGYEAIGGEYLLIPLVFVLVYWILGYVFEE